MYQDVKMLNEKGVMTLLVIVECRVIMGSFPMVPKVNKMFNLHELNLMAQDLDSYTEEIIREFYVSYVASLRGSIDKRARPAKQDRLTYTIVWGCGVDISKSTIRRYMAPPSGHNGPKKLQS